jgi:hypothetical protein
MASHRMSNGIGPTKLTDAQLKLLEALRTVGHGWLYVANNGHSLADLVLLHHLGLAEVDGGVGR